MDLSQARLLELGLDALESEDADLPAGMGHRVMAAASTRSRPSTDAEWATTAGSGVTSQAAFIKTAAELAGLLDGLAPEEWTPPVRDLVVHLVGVERYMIGQLGRRPPLAAPRREDHYPVTRAAAADVADATDAELARSWWLEAMELTAASGELGPGYPVAYHHLAGHVRGLLVVRTFELWTHDDDIRRMTNRGPNLLDDSRLTLMSSELMGSLSLGMALKGTTQPGRTARFNLTGSGGASYDVALAPGEVASSPDITVSAGTIDLCRLASNRLEHLTADVDGDASLLDPILVGATAFALD